MADGVCNSSRRVLSNVAAPEKDKKINALESSGDFVLKSFLPVSENCHFERYNYVYENNDKLSVVYDTKAQIVTLTANESVLNCAIAAFERKPNKNCRSKAKPNAKKEVFAHATDNKKVSGKTAPDVAETPEYKNGFAIRKCPPERMEGIIGRIAALKGVVVKSETGNDGIITYIITEKATKQKCLLRYVVKKQSAQLQGKRSNLFGEVQVIISRDSDFGDVVESHMELTGEQMRKSAVQRSLKKLLPDAFELLSEQSKIDLGMGRLDIGNNEVKLSDYSSLLVPPYRGLERFIYDLQQAHGITVKMIGQAYEKDENGAHVLKACYRRKGGVVYSEVMSALYIEYFEKRNYYAHSDNTDFGQSRIITDKAMVKSIFDNLCAIINYNAKKLKETGFKIK